MLELRPLQEARLSATRNQPLKVGRAENSLIDLGTSAPSAMRLRLTQAVKYLGWASLARELRFAISRLHQLRGSRSMLGLAIEVGALALECDPKHSLRKMTAN